MLNKKNKVYYNGVGRGSLMVLGKYRMRKKCIERIKGLWTKISKKANRVDHVINGWGKARNPGIPLDS